MWCLLIAMLLVADNRTFAMLAADGVSMTAVLQAGERGGSAGRSSDGSRGSRRPQRRTGKARSDQEDYET